MKQFILTNICAFLNIANILLYFYLIGVFYKDYKVLVAAIRLYLVFDAVLVSKIMLWQISYGNWTKFQKIELNKHFYLINFQQTITKKLFCYKNIMIFVETIAAHLNLDTFKKFLQGMKVFHICMYIEGFFLC